MREACLLPMLVDGWSDVVLCILPHIMLYPTLAVSQVVVDVEEVNGMLAPLVVV